ncbi:MAG: threonylcarbamoyl-AMP synthase [Alphaproteobacteria bacterium CG11_big_fil_rev_8_21_14_0_20_44_7]|nr:MAG: threonylcarbamoyl-AMP synthase [Alphaproteobacteria bacterium CG11_big_fil_rev_8_21_14_0_20_44_7]
MSTDEIQKAVEILQSGEIAAIPTETVYGLAANAEDNLAVAKIYEAKTRPNFNPLIVHIYNIEQAQQIAVFNDTALELAQKYWPGGLTLVLPKKNPTFATLATAGLESVALRCPAHPIAREILRESGLMLAAPSANISGKLSPTKAEHVRRDFPYIYIVDGGECEIGLESTVIGFENEQPILLRSGVLQIDGAIENDSDKIISPGQLIKHYAPKNPIRINVVEPKAGEQYLGFGDMGGLSCALNLSEAGDMRIAAANLFGFLHQLDSNNMPIAVAPIPNTGIGSAINDRLSRAST